jgi:hypothetical protein
MISGLSQKSSVRDASHDGRYEANAEAGQGGTQRDQSHPVPGNAFIYLP